ncbi:MAG: T9SS type A sorting domain-containing protein, partial [Luteibaculum sp.]
LNQRDFLTSYNSLPDTNFYIEEIQRFNEDLWVLIRMDYYENDSIRWEKTELHKYSMDLIEHKATIPLSDSLNFNGYNFLVDSSGVICIGLSSRNRFFGEEPSYFTLKRFFTSNDSLYSLSIPLTEVLNGGQFPFNKIHYNPQRKEYFWFFDNGLLELARYSDEAGFNSQNILPARFTRIKSKLLKDRIIVTGDHKDSFGQFDGVIFQEFNLNYQEGSNLGLEPEKEDYKLEIMDVQQLENPDLTAALNESPPFQSGEKTVGKIVYLGPPGSLDVTKEIPFQLAENFFIQSFRNLPNDRLAVYGTTQHPDKQDSTVAVFIKANQDGIVGMDEFSTEYGSIPLLQRNPVQNTLSLQLPENLEPRNLYICNHLGQKIMTLKPTNQKHHNISELSDGLYLVVLEDQLGNIHQQRFIKE